MTTQVERLKPGLLDAVAPHGFEDFLTDAFCWLLSEVPGLGPQFLEFLRKEQEEQAANRSRPSRPPRRIPELAPESLRWETQNPFPRKSKRDGKRAIRPDMTCTDGKCGVVFEHKTWTNPHKNQLRNLRENAPDLFECAPIVLITGRAGQHQQDPDLALCWSQIHGFLDERAKGAGDTGFAVREFQTLLKERGLGPMAILEPKAIRNYFVVTDLKDNLKRLIKSLSQREWGEDRKGADLIKRGERDGRFGLDLRPWNPGVFVGVILDGRDHGVKPRATGLDASVILDCEQSLHGQTQRFEDLLCKIYRNEGLPEGWEVQRLWKAEEIWDDGKYRGRPNPWHPLHIRKPLLEVFDNAESWGDQADRFYSETRKVADLVLRHLNAPWKAA